VGSGDNALPFVYVTDVVQGLLLALEREHAVSQAYNISNDRPLSQQQFLDAIAHEIGASPPRVHIPYQVLYVVGAIAERLALLTHSRHQPVLTRLGFKLFGTATGTRSTRRGASSATILWSISAPESASPPSGTGPRVSRTDRRHTPWPDQANRRVSHQSPAPSAPL
jgi:hypothetical protein